jgi:arylsulfatase A-like enzyme
MHPHNAIVILVDRLGAGHLGPYGNTWIETPGFNRLASQSLLWEQMIATSPTLAGTYRSIRSGSHPLSVEVAGSSNLWERLRQSGIQTALLTDELQLGPLFPAEALDERIECPIERAGSAAVSPEQTQFWQLFVAALEWLTHPRQRFCLVVHSRGMDGAWDAPREFRERFVDEDDPPVPDFVEPPNRALGKDADPDEVFGINQAYAGQIALLDRCLEMLHDVLFERGVLDNALLIVTSPRGFPLGEHGSVGQCGDALHEELLHVPALVRRPDQRHAMERCQTLVEPADLFRTLADWFELPPVLTPAAALTLLAPHSIVMQRQCVVSAIDLARSIRTPAWFLRRGADAAVELYAKPDDRWEVNEVADRCAAVVEELTSRLIEYEALARANRLAEFPGLPDHLLRPAE